MKKKQIRWYIPDLEQCLRCKHGVSSFRQGRLPDADPDNEHCNSLPFAFMPVINPAESRDEVTCTLFEDKYDDTG